MIYDVVRLSFPRFCSPESYVYSGCGATGSTCDIARLACEVVCLTVLPFTLLPQPNRPSGSRLRRTAFHLSAFITDYICEVPISELYRLTTEKLAKETISARALQVRHMHYQIDI